MAIGPMGAQGGADVSGLLAAIPLFAPQDGRERGRISATTAEPGSGAPNKVVVDFGWRSEHARLDLEIATRRFAGAPAPPQEDPGRRLRLFCAEREFLERQARGLADGSAPGPPEGSTWSSTDIAVEGTPRTFTVLRTPHAWVAAAALEPPFLVRLFAPERPAGLHALRRITDPADLEPVRGRG